MHILPLSVKFTLFVNLAADESRGQDRAVCMPWPCSRIDYADGSGDGVAYDPDDEIIVTTGGMEAVYLAMLATLDAGDDILIPDPGYANYFSQVQMAQANVVPVPLYEKYGFRMRAADVEAAITPRTRALLLNSPSNPTGAIIDPVELDAIADVARRHDLWVISDEVYRAFVYETAFDACPSRRCPV